MLKLMIAEMMEIKSIWESSMFWWFRGLSYEKEALRALAFAVALAFSVFV